MYQHFIIQSLYEAQHVSGDTPPIIRSLKLHWQPLVFHTWKAVVLVVGGHRQAQDISKKMQQCIKFLLLLSTNLTSNSLPRMKNQRLPAEF
jgi:hypothetical protein